jgi:hypothetical protein
MKFSIAQQIEEVAREIKLRDDVYARQVRQGAMRQSIADFHLGRMQAALATLQWVRDNEAAIKAAVKKP